MLQPKLRRIEASQRKWKLLHLMISSELSTGFRQGLFLRIRSASSARGIELIRIEDTLELSAAKPVKLKTKFSSR